MSREGFKIVLVGDSGVGKTTIVQWLILNRRPNDNCPTIGAAYITKNLFLDGDPDEIKKIKLNIWDTAGQERFRTISRIYYKNTCACICVFDLMNKDSFKNIRTWLNDYRENNNITNYITVIVGNKADHPEEQWKVNIDDIVGLSEKENCKYMLTNCITGEGIKELFNYVGNEILKNNKIYDILSQEQRKEIIITDLEKRQFIPIYPKCKC